MAPLLSPGAPDQSRSVEAMVMSIPVVGKLNILQRVAPPIKAPSPASPSPIVRGSIVAVEGDELDATGHMLHHLESFLKRNDEFDVRVMAGPSPPVPNPTIKDFLLEIAKWHTRTQEMVDFVTGVEYQKHDEKVKEDAAKYRAPDGRTASVSTTNEESDVDMEEGEVLEGSRKDAQEARKARKSALEIKKAEMAASIERESRRQSAAKETTPKIPLLLVSNYILRACNSWTSELPINDAYSPADHWVWSASLWRGIVGADLTVYVKNVDKEMEEAVSAGGAAPETTHAKAQVDIKDEVSAIIVKREKGKVEDAAGRRVAFEVGEWVRTQAGKSA